MTTDIDLSREQVKHIVETLSNGDPAEISAILFGDDSLTDDQRKIPLGLLQQLRGSSLDDAVTVAEAGYQRPFWMLILKVPWLQSARAGSFHPLLLAHEAGIPKVAGFVLPWNEISSLFTEEQLAGARRLAVWWATWLQDRNATNC